MKSWSEAKIGMTVYITNEIELFDDEDNSIGKTKPLQKAFIDEIFNDEIKIVIEGGKYNYCDFYFHPSEDDPSELLTIQEYKELKMTEVKVWKELKKYVNVINKLNKKSYDIMTVRELIEKHNKK